MTVGSLTKCGTFAKSRNVGYAEKKQGGLMMRKNKYVLMPIMLTILFCGGCKTTGVTTMDPPRAETEVCGSFSEELTSGESRQHEELFSQMTESMTKEEGSSGQMLDSSADVVERNEMESEVEEIVSTTEDVILAPPITEIQITTEAVTEDVAIQVETNQVPEMENATKEVPTTETPTTAAPVPQSLSAKVKGDFFIGDVLSAGDFSITVTMSDGSTKKNPAGWSADLLYLASHETVITVTYQELTTQVTVNASERPTEAPTTEAPTQAPTDSPIVEPITPSFSLDRGAAETAWNIQKGIIESQAFNLETMDYTGKPITWSERLYELACQRAKEIVDNFSHDGFHSIDASAENIAKGVPYPDMVINGWYNSAGHKNNMLGGWNYGAIAKYGNYWVALFSNNP